jgi:lipopolysaccharide transport system ATP-binding protein
MSEEQATTGSHAEPAIYHVTHWKAGSQWVKGMLADLFPGRAVKTDHQMQRGVFREAIRPGGIYSPLYINRKAFEASPAAAVPHRTFVVIRDLRDTLVSWYYSFRYSHPVNAKVGNHRGALEGMSVEDGLVYLAEHHDFFALAMIPATWRTSGELIVRYEELIADTAGALGRVLDHCGLRAAPGELGRVVDAWRFEAKAGRAPGQENPVSHYRKGVSGDWRGYFTARLGAAFYPRYGDLMRKLGYDIEPVGV